jgi:hypothetical protein
MSFIVLFRFDWQRRPARPPRLRLLGEPKGFRKERTRVRVAYAIFDRMIRRLGALVSHVLRQGRIHPH